MFKTRPRATRAERNEFVLRLSVKIAVVGHLVFAIIVPLAGADPGALAWNIAKWLSPGFIMSWAFLTALSVLVAQWVRTLRMVGGIAYMAFCLTYAVLVGEPRAAMFATTMSFLGLTLAWTGIPEDNDE